MIVDSARHTLPQKLPQRHRTLGTTKWNVPIPPKLVRVEIQPS